VESLPSILDHLCESCSAHFERFQHYLKLQDIQWRTTPRLVRGLDYYVRTTFEIVSDRLGPTQNAILGGGRYDGLSELIGGPPTKGFGFAMGMERVVLLISGREELGGEFSSPAPDVFLAYLDQTDLEECILLARELRDRGLFAYVDFEGRSLRAQMRLANRMRARYTSVVGEAERSSGEYPLKRMSDGLQVTVRRGEIASLLLGREGSHGPTG
jgi:histidyl-tRNA synthetase